MYSFKSHSGKETEPSFANRKNDKKANCMMSLTGESVSPEEENENESEMGMGHEDNHCGIEGGDEIFQ